MRNKDNRYNQYRKSKATSHYLIMNAPLKYVIKRSENKNDNELRKFVAFWNDTMIQLNETGLNILFRNK